MTLAAARTSASPESAPGSHDLISNRPGAPSSAASQAAIVSDVTLQLRASLRSPAIIQAGNHTGNLVSAHALSICNRVAHGTDLGSIAQRMLPNWSIAAIAS